MPELVKLSLRDGWSVRAGDGPELVLIFSHACGDAFSVPYVDLVDLVSTFHARLAELAKVVEPAEPAA